jgi:hypothetical protein
VSAKIDEPNPRAGHEILHRSGDTHFAWARSGRDASSDMHRDASQLSTHQLAFTRMQARPDLNPERPHRHSDGLRTTNRPRGAIEPGHEGFSIAEGYRRRGDGDLFSGIALVLRDVGRLL